MTLTSRATLVNGSALVCRGLVAGQVLHRAFPPPEVALTRLAAGESAIECPSPLNMLKYTYDYSCY
jgi:hypothetical protein